MKNTVIIIILFIQTIWLVPSFAVQPNPRILIETELGNIEIEVYQHEAPVTAANFLRYVNEHRLNDAVFYRVVRQNNQPDNDIKISVVQWGLKSENHPKRLPEIEHEPTNQTGILHKDGVISMARLAPGTASSEFFICIGDQPELDFYGRRNPDGQGFAAFGRVVRGMKVIQKIHELPAHGQYLTPEIEIRAVRAIR